MTYWSGESVELHHGDCIQIMAGLPAGSVDAIVTDPPYGLEFMGKEWDRFKVDRKQPGDPGYTDGPGPYGRAKVRYGQAASYGGDNLGAISAFGAWCLQWAVEALRVLKPGGHLLAFGGTRTWHRLTCAVEDAGFEIRDSIAWLYGSGFPKSLDVSKAIDKAAGAERVGAGIRNPQCAYYPEPCEGHSDAGRSQSGMTYHRDKQDPATGAAQQWAGWGTALKPAFEPIVMARKPLTGTVAANVQAYGTGALNIDGCRIGTDDQLGRAKGGWLKGGYVGGDSPQWDSRGTTVEGGRWPANVVLDADQAAALDKQSGVTVSTASTGRNGADQQAATFGLNRTADQVRGHDDQGGASRFFYVAKAPTTERPNQGDTTHPTVKPIDLMQWLVRLVTPPHGTVLDPFAGSGTTGEAAVREGFQTILIEQEPSYLPLIRERFRRPINYLLDFDP